MHLPLWAIILLALGSLGFLILLFRPRRDRDLTEAPRLTIRPPASLAAPPRVPDPAGIPPETVAALRAMVDRGQKIHAIKQVRELTGCGLAEAKDWVDRL